MPPYNASFVCVFHAVHTYIYPLIIKVMWRDTIIFIRVCPGYYLDNNRGNIYGMYMCVCAPPKILYYLIKNFVKVGAPSTPYNNNDKHYKCKM